VCCSDCSFLSKSVEASRAGAVAVVIRDNDIENSELMIDMTDDGTGREVDIAAFFMLGKDGSVRCPYLPASVMSLILVSSVCNPYGWL